MEIRDLFAKDINRSINGVVKVQDDKSESVRQELEEYVVTRELQRHFADFFEVYDRSLDVPTDKVGVWISGFFGSGKSHFLKILSYVLANNEVAGKRVIDYFDGKVADPMVASKMRRCCDVPTETILFNIDTMGGSWKEGTTIKTALLRAFERVFFEHRGFFGEDLKLAKLEDYIDSCGKTQEFRDAYERACGGSWVEERETYEYRQDDIVPVLMQVMGMSEQAACNWFDGTEDDAIAVDRFVRMVNSYVDARTAQEGGKFRLLFMADEVGQFIGDDVNLMLSLQTLVEELGTKCGGRVWVMVTSQEAIDEVAMVVGDDFSKIQGRFNTRLSLSSSSVDEVIQRRVLDKTQAAKTVLDADYENTSTVLKNLFAFDGSRNDLIGYKSARDFTSSYPFVNYQFKVLPDVMTEIRKHGVKAKHMSTGERSMLSAFQESAQAVQGAQVGLLVPFWRFFDAISKDLEHGVIRVIDRAERAAEDDHGLKPYDVRILKLLYLIRYIDYVKSNVENISILMIDQMDIDKAALKDNVKESLARLVRENYVARQGDTYNFLTDEEQDMARAISETQIDTAQVIESIKKVLFSGVYAAKKLRHGANDFPIDRYVDGSIYGTTNGGMTLNIITLADDLSRASDSELALKSSGQALLVLSNEADYFDVIMNAAKIRKYAQTLNRDQLPPSTQQILANKLKEAAYNEKEAAGLIEEALLHARCAVDGRMVEIRSVKPADVIDQALAKLADTTFNKAGYITDPAQTDDDIRRALSGQIQQTLDGMEEPNARALKEVADFLKVQDQMHQPTTMGDLHRKYQQKPFGWREIDVANVVAQLVATQRATVSVGGAVVALRDRKMLECLRKQADKAQVRQRVRMSDTLLKAAANLLRDLTGTPHVPRDEDELVAFAVDALEGLLEKCTELFRNNYTGITREYPYPGRDVVEQGAALMSRTLEAQHDPQAFLKQLVDSEDDLLDWHEDFEPVEAFFTNQKAAFDSGVTFMSLMKGEGFYLESNAQAFDAVRRVDEILKTDKPYSQIRYINELTAPVLEAHKELVADKRNELLAIIDKTVDSVKQYASGQEGFVRVATDAAGDADRAAASIRSNAHDATTAVRIDALKQQLDSWRNGALSKINRAVAAEQERIETERRRTQVTEDGEHVTNITHAHPEAKPKPATKVKLVTLASLETTAYKLSNEQDVDAYLEQLRERLLHELDGVDAICLS